MRGSVIFLVFVVLGLGQMSFAQEQVIHSRIALRVKAQIEAQAEAIRLSDTYQRVYPMCSTDSYYYRLVYAIQGAKQVVDIASLNPQALADLRVAHLYVSPLLAHDLEDDGFYLAMKDCKLSEGEAKIFVIDLITFDLSGKLLGGVGAYFLYRYTFNAFKYFWGKAPVLTGTLGAVQAAARVYGIAKAKPSGNPNYEFKLSPPEETDSLSPQNIDVTPDPQGEKDVARSVLTSIDQNIAAVERELKTASPRDVDSLNRELLQLQSERSAIAKEFNLEKTP